MQRDMACRRRPDTRDFQARRVLLGAQEERWARESAERAAWFPRRFRGLWDWISGRYAEIRRQNEHETYLAWRRDQEQREALIAFQLDERQRLQERILEVRRAHALERDQLEQDIAAYMLVQGDGPDLNSERLARMLENTSHKEHLREQNGLGLNLGL